MRYAAILVSAIILVFTSCSGAVSGQADIESFVDDSLNFFVSYNANGGTGDIASSVHAVGSSVPLDSGSSMTHPDYPLHIWNTAADASGTFYPLGSVIKMPPKDLVLYAIWEQEFNLSYNSNGGAGGSISSQTRFPGDAVAVAVNSGVFYRTDDYAFAGWNTEPDGTGKNYAPGSTFVFTNALVTLYARWKAVSGPVTLVTPTVPAGVISALDRHGLTSTQYWEFDDANQVSYDSPSLCFAYNHPFSISVWFRANELPPLPNYHYWYIVSLVGVAGDFNYFMTLDGPNAGALAACVTKNCAGSNFVLYPVSVGVWHHAVMVYNGRMLELYVDGASRGTTLYTFGVSPTPMTPMNLGGGSGSCFQGSIGELTVYDRAISADEVAALSAN